MEKFVLGGGCFWCLDAVYRNVRGVSSSIAGYAGGHVKNPTYEQVCHMDTGHAEVLEVTFDPEEVSAENILDIFFTLHDPTQLNRQGADVGSQYRSSMMYENESQEKLFETSIERAKEIWGEGVVTEVVPLETFYEAESYHQDYFAKNPNQGYCLAVVSPKLAKVRASFSSLMR
jgi:peptide-methionine (S)-S-oxide reductase